ncbi:MAG: AzlC family ABC transporter permease [Lentisphaeria bacterium]
MVESPSQSQSSGFIWRFCLLQTIPIASAYLFLGMAFGIYMTEAGWHPGWVLTTSMVVYAGSLQFVLVALLASGASFLTVALMTLFINTRHLFYGIGFIEPFRKMGWKYPYMIFALTDETYSLLCSVPVPEGIDRRKVYFRIAVLDHGYWLCGSLAGALLGRAVPIDFAGIEFSMTALFVIIFLNQWKQCRSHLPAVTGLCFGVFFLILLGPDAFLLPTLGATVGLLLVLRQKVVAAESEAARG